MITLLNARRSSRAGITIMLVVAFMGIFALVLGTVAGYALQQAKYGRALYAREQALQIAEAGLEYYRWFLAHNPNNLTNGTGQPGPYTYTVSDPEGGVLGTASLTVTGNSACGVVQSIDITSRGTSTAAPGFPRTISARYMRPTVAQYAYINNNNVWFGATNVGVGPYHANGGIRMDGSNNSIVSSAVSTWQCSSTYGCSPTQTVPGVWGVGGGSSLWQYPVPPVDFPGMAVNFSTLQGYAQSSGIYLSPTSVRVMGVQQGSSYSSVGSSDEKGYHLLFRSDGSVDVYRVTAAVSGIYSYNSNDGWRYDYPVIASETYQGRYTPPSDCAIIYSQAKTWIEGTVKNKVTLIAADTGSYAPDIVLQGNVLYAASDGTTGLTAVAEGSQQIGLTVPDAMSLQGIFVAQTGSYGRDYYVEGYLPSQYNSSILQSSLTVNGSLVSALRGGLCWGSGGTCSSGFQTRTNTYDRILAFSPPPFTPPSSADYTLVLWREQ